MKTSYMLAPSEIVGANGFYDQIKIDGDIEMDAIDRFQQGKHRYFCWRRPVDLLPDANVIAVIRPSGDS